MGKYTTIQEYVDDQDGVKAKIVGTLVGIVVESAPTAKSSIKWAQPVFENEQGPFCFIKAHKNHVNIGFWRGVQMKDPSGVLEGTGEKMRHIKISDPDEIDPELISDLVKQGIALNEEFGNPTR